MAKRSKKKKGSLDQTINAYASGQPWWQRDEFRAVLLIVAIILAYEPVWQAGFIWDDDNHLTANPCIVGPLGLKEIWTTSAAMYYPLTLTTFWVEHALWELEPLPYHLVNVLMHGVCAILLWRVLRQLQIPGAWLGAALWALHPVQVESVAWITEMKNTLSCLFYLLSILFFLKGRDAAPTTKQEKLDYALALLCALLAVLSKSSTVMLPGVLALCAWWRGDRWSWRTTTTLIPFLLISATVSGWTIWEQKFHSGALGGEWGQSWPERIVIAGRDVWFYLGKLAWPHPLIFIYPRWDIDATRLVEYLPVVGFAVALFGLWWLRHGPMRPVFFAFAYFVILLFPVLGFFNVYFFRYSFVGDHFQYLASMGPLALTGAGITTVFGYLEKANRFLELLLGGLLLFILGLLTWSQCGMYANEETLWRTTIEQNPGCWLAYNNYGDVLLKKGQAEAAMEHYEQALRIKPDYALAHSNLGGVLQQAGRISEAIEQYEQALQLDPNDAVNRYDLGGALLQTGQEAKAMEQFEQALLINPDYADARNDLGLVLFQTGLVSEAMEQFQQALQINPSNAAVHNNLGLALVQTGRVPEAMEQYEQALQLKPDYAEASYNLANALLQAGRIPDAIQQYELALQLKPDYAEAHNNLGGALFRTGRLSEAAEEFQQALRIRPDFTDARNNLARVQALLKNVPAKN